VLLEEESEVSYDFPLVNFILSGFTFNSGGLAAAEG
jgi:hypothetical protein